jgi:hypothetical protein
MTTHSASLPACNIGNDGRNGPVTRARQRRTFIIYAALVLLGLLPWLNDASPALRAGGLGLMLPGAGFIAVGGWWLLLVPVTLVLFGISLIAWFGSGMVVAPIIIWLGSALLAWGVAGETVWPYAPFASGALLAVIALRLRSKAAASLKADLAVRDERRAYLPAMLQKIRDAAVPAPDPATRELDPEQLAALRYALDRALQPVGTLKGFTKIDQFQTAALRYQLNTLGYLLSMVQCNVTPNFHGYMSAAQRSVIEQYLQKPIWSYWFWESLWGQFRLDANPAVRDNIMLTGFLGINLNLYMLNTGDRRYLEKGSLPFRWNEKKVFLHDASTITNSVQENMRSNAFCLYPCEPNWIYTPCNFRGLTALLTYDRLCGTRHYPDIKDNFFAQLDAEFTKPSGSLYALRSSSTGLPVPFPFGEASRTAFDNGIDTSLALQDWAINRHEVFKEANGQLVFVPPAKMVDFGNYKMGPTAILGGLLQGAREVGDAQAADLIKARIDEVCGGKIEGGVLSFNGSNSANLVAMTGILTASGDWKRTVQSGPPASAFTGPLLAEASYPEVLVARATSPHGDDLDLVLYNGAAAGRQTLGLSRLQAGARYTASGSEALAFTADANGRAELAVMLDGRTQLLITPAA